MKRNNQYIKKNYLYINVFFYLITLYFFWISFYGASALYIHHGDNLKLANPNIPSYLKVIDEAILILSSFWFGLLYKRNIINIKPNSRLAKLFYLTIAPLCLLLFIQFGGYILTLDFKYIKLFKNSLSAILVILFLFSLYKLNLFKKITDFLLFILSISILFALLHYNFFPYEVYETRIFGSYLNPNVTGFVCLFGIALANYCMYRYLKITCAYILIFTVGIFASGSLSALIILILYLFSKLFFQSILISIGKLNIASLRNILIVIFLVLFGFFVETMIYPSYNKDESRKLLSVKSFLSNSESSEAFANHSFANRLFLLNEIKSNFLHPSRSYSPYTQSDSTVYNITRNYPVFIFYLFVASFLSSFYLKFLSKKERFIFQLVNPMFYFVFFSIFPYTFVQYVLEEIPSFILFYFAYVLLALDSLTDRNVKKI